MVKPGRITAEMDEQRGKFHHGYCGGGIAVCGSAGGTEGETDMDLGVLLSLFLYLLLPLLLLFFLFLFFSFLFPCGFLFIIGVQGEVRLCWNGGVR